jgi:hypothetical protein
MADQKISQLTTIVTVDTAADLFPIVDTSAVETKKITPSALKTALSLNNVDNTTDANKPVSSAQQTALDAKVTGNTAITGATKTKITYDAKGLVTAGADATTADIADSLNKRYVTDAQLVVVGNTSGTNTGDNATNSQYSGLAASKQDTLVSATNIKTVNSTSLLGSGDVAVQATLVSGTNIKTINSTSLLGSGDIVLSASPSGVSGAIQFSNGSAFASDAANFFWDDTNNRLGVGTNAPSATGHFKGSGATSATTSLLVQNSAGSTALQIRDDRSIDIVANELGNNAWGQSIKFFGSSGEVRTNLGGGVGFFGTWYNAGSEQMRLSTNNNLLLGTATDVASSKLTIESTTKGFLPPRMTTTQKNAIASPAAGLVLYDSTTNKLQCYNGSTWNDLF